MMRFFERLRVKHDEEVSDYYLERPVFATGTGRCGTHFLYELMNAHKHVNAFHIQHPDADSFFRYCAWNKLPIDTADFIAYRQKYFEESKAQKKLYFESNPYLSFSIHPLYSQFQAKFIFIIRNPEAVVRSHIIKGWYSEELLVKDSNKAIGFQYKMKTNHFLGRIIPTGSEFERWSNLTRIGKLAWMWNAVNLKIKEQLDNLGGENYFLIKVEELDYSNFLNLLEFMNLETKGFIQEKFISIKEAKPGKGKQNFTSWSMIETEEFYKETAIGRKIFEY